MNFLFFVNDADFVYLCKKKKFKVLSLKSKFKISMHRLKDSDSLFTNTSTSLVFSEKSLKLRFVFLNTEHFQNRLSHNSGCPKFTFFLLYSYISCTKKRLSSPRQF